MKTNVSAVLDKAKFNCPHCGVLCRQDHYQITNLKENDKLKPSLSEKPTTFSNGQLIHRTVITMCTECYNYLFWKGSTLIYPYFNDLDEPSNDMPIAVSNIYKEAANVFMYSPRASSALVRLAIETMLKELGESGSLNDMISSIVKKEIPKHVQEGLDAIRYYGNKGIHAGEIDFNDDRETVIFLFELLNILVEELVTKKKKISSFYEKLPESFKKHIEERDKKIKVSLNK